MAKQKTENGSQDFEFELDHTDFIEKTPDPHTDPTMQRLAGETMHEGGTLQKIAQQDNAGGDDQSFLKPEPKVAEPVQVSVGGDGPVTGAGAIDDPSSAAKVFGGGNTMPPPPGSGGGMQGMPPKVDINNYANIPFMADDGDGGDSGDPSSGTGGGLGIPNSIVEENAAKIAGEFVMYEEMIATGFLKQYSKINIQKIKRALVVNDIDPQFGDKLLFVVESYNKDVENTFVFSKDEKKLLRDAWKDVLMQYTEISENVTPELRLIMAHIPIVIRMWMSMKEFKETKAVNEKMISDTLADIRREMKQKYGNKAGNIYDSSSSETKIAA